MERGGLLTNVFNQISGEEYAKSYSFRRSSNASENLDAELSAENRKEHDRLLKDPDARLSFEQRQVKDDLQKIRSDNPLETLAGRRAPINLQFKKLKSHIEKEKAKFRDTLRRLTLRNLRKSLTDTMRLVREFKARLRQMQNDLLDLIQRNNDFIDQVSIAIESQNYDRDKTGSFIDPSLNKMVSGYMKRHDLDPNLMKEFSLEQMLAMVEEEREYLKSENILISKHLDQVSDGLDHVNDLEDKLKSANDMLNSNLPDEIKQQKLADLMDDIDLNALEQSMEKIEGETQQLLHRQNKMVDSTRDEIEKSNFIQKSSEFKPDPILSGL